MKGLGRGSGFAASACLAAIAACRVQPPPAVPWFEGEARTPGVLPPPETDVDVPAFVANFRIRSPEATDDGFGSAMAMGNRTLAIAAPGAAGGGAVWVFDTTDLSRRPTRLGPGGDTSVVGFGSAVAVSTSGQYIAVGAPGTTVDGVPEAGAVLAWRRDPGAWKFIGRFQDDTPADHAHLGASVAINEVTILAGAPDASFEEITDTGMVLAWVASPSRTWREAQRMTLAKATGGARFGSCIALEGGDALIGARNASSASGTFSGSASLYRNQLGKWKAAPNAVMVGSRIGPLDRFGSCVSVHLDPRLVKTPKTTTGQPVPARPGQPSGSPLFDPRESEPSMLAVGAPGANLPGKGNAGCLYVYEQNPKTRAWREDARLTSPRPEDNAAFGSSVSISRDRLVTGSPGWAVGGTPASGIAHVFEHRPERDRMVWKPAAELRPEESTVNGKFGSDVSATDDCIAVTEPGAGLVHLFRRTADGPGLPVVVPTEASTATTAKTDAGAAENPPPVSPTPSSL